LLLDNLAARHPGKVRKREGVAHHHHPYDHHIQVLRISACSWGQVWVVDLREDKTILRGLVRTLPQRIPRETWVAIMSEVLAGCKGLVESLPEALESFRGKGMSFEGLQSGLDSVLSVSTSVEKVLNTIPGSKKEIGKPLQLLVGAMIRNLGAGESACMCIERTPTLTRRNRRYAEHVSPLCI
jgi:hypothetical protein